MIYKEFIKNSLEMAAKIAMDNFGKVSAVAKAGDPNQVLTETDKAVGNLLIIEIKKRFPEHNIIDEEAGVINNGSELTWVNDPIDGTSNYAEGLPSFGIMMGLLKGGEPIAGGVILPFYQELYYAEKGEGSFCNNNRIKVSEEQNLINSLVAFSMDGHQEDPDKTREEAKILAEIILGIRNIRASGSVFDAMMVAKGKFGGYVNQSSRIWDLVAQHIIVVEAGGVHSDFWGNEIDYSEPLEKANQNFTFCAAPPKLHKQIQSKIHLEE